MDLDLKNYNTEELLVILQVEKEDPSLDDLQQALFKKIESIKEAKEELPDTKENIITFFTKAFFKIQNNYNLTNDTLGNEPSIGIQTQLQPEMQPTYVVQQNNSMISKHDDKNPIPIWNTPYKAGTVNPLQRTSFKKILNVNSRFRQNYNTTDSSDFIFALPYPVKKVVSMKLKSTEFPKTVYSFSSKIGSSSFKINDNSANVTHVIEISNGCYEPDDLTEHINSLMSNVNVDVSLNYNNNTGKMTFEKTTTTFKYGLNFGYDDTNKCPVNIPGVDEAHLTLGWMLGFRGSAMDKLNAVKLPNYKKQPNKSGCCQELGYLTTDISMIYTGAGSYTGEGLFDGHGTRYFLISVNDYQNNHNETFISPFKDNALSDNNILAKISTECCSDNCCNHVERIYFGPTDLTKLHIKVMDEFGRVIDINNADFSLTLELEVLYDL